jgi:hypothetical protein
MLPVNVRGNGMDRTEVTEVNNISNFESTNFMLNVTGNFCIWLRVSIHRAIFMLRAGTRITKTEVIEVSNIANFENTNFMLNVRGNFFMGLRVSIHREIFMLRAGTRITSIMNASNGGVMHVTARFATTERANFN